MRARMLAFCLAVIAVCQWPRLPALPMAVLLSCACVCLLLSAHKIRVIGVFAAFGVGLCWGIGFGQERVAALLPAALEESDFWVQGHVVGLPRRSGRAQQVQFQVIQSCFDLVPSDCQAEESFFSPRRILLNYYGAQILAPGQAWQWRVRLNRPHGFANPGGFDYEGWLFLQGFAAKGYVRETPLNVRLPSRSGGIDSVRFALRTQLETALETATYKGILIALILGDREDISQEHWALFTATGTNHLIVISGLHVGFIALLGYGLGMLIARRSAPLLWVLPAQKCGAVAALLAAASYSLLAGFTLPTQRALLMLLVFMGGRLMGRAPAPSSSYLLAMSVVLIVNPLNPIGAGFWLSFGAVGTLLLLYGARVRIQVPQGVRGFWQRWCEPQFVVAIGMSVPLLVWTSQLSLFSPLANLIAIPVVSLVIVPLALLGVAALLCMPPVGAALLQLDDRFLRWLTLALQRLSETMPEWGQWQASGLSPSALVAGLCVSALMLAPQVWPKRLLLPVFLVPLLWPKTDAIPVGHIQLTVLDVGQGLAIVGRTAHHTLLYDTGPQFSEDFNAGTGVVLPYLRHKGIRQLDALVVSHADNDHQGGLAALLATMPVVRLLVSRPAPFPMPAEACKRGQTWEWDKVRFEMLYPLGAEEYAGNNSSCVLRIRAGEGSVLLTGDIEAEAEAALLALDGPDLASDVLSAPHHGSQTSSTEPFLHAVAPAIVLVSAGYRSQFGHPAPSVSQRYGALGIAVWNTALSGALTLELGPGRATTLEQVVEYRRVQPRFWYQSAGASSRRLHGVCWEDC